MTTLSHPSYRGSVTKGSRCDSEQSANRSSAELSLILLDPDRPCPWVARSEEGGEFFVTQEGLVRSFPDDGLSAWAINTLIAGLSRASLARLKSPIQGRNWRRLPVDLKLQ